MPGIAGIVTSKPHSAARAIVDSMLRTMEHEPWYVSGNCAFPESGLYAGWVAHPESFAADQLFQNEARDVSLVFSGECVADPDVIRSLRDVGHEFDDRTGAWLAHSYEEDGDNFFEQLNGLFSGVLVDQRCHKLFLFNDRFGTERVYWHQGPDTFYFASEAKALLRVLPQLRSLEPNAVRQFLQHGCTVGAQSLFRGIELLPGGSLWSFESRSGPTRSRYFSSVEWEQQSTLGCEEYCTELAHTFDKVILRCCESRRKTGVSLTAGLDSRMIVSSPAVRSTDPICYTFSGPYGSTLDDEIARKVATACGLRHRIIRLGSDFFSEFATFADRTVYISDGYSGVCGAHEIYFAQQARQLAPVRLTGNFGSEILRGVSTFKAMQRGEHSVTFAAFCEIPFHLFSPMTVSRSQITFRTPYLDNELVALAYRCPPELRSSPYFALHFAAKSNPALQQIPTDMAVAYCQNNLVTLIKRSISKVCFKLDYYNSEGLPGGLAFADPALRHLQVLGITGRHKYLQYRTWFQRQLAPYFWRAVDRARDEQSSYWNPDQLRQLVREHTAGKRNHMHKIAAILTLDAIERLLLRGLSQPSVEAEPDSALPPEYASNR
jgi:asparagine synthase (glutamine-hydrolysing)